MKKRAKGFIGPIGDDIPSIFPIVAGILLFLGTMIYVNNAVQQRNAELQLSKAALDLSYVVLEKGFMSKSEFQSVCTASARPTGERSNVHFAIILKNCGQVDSQDPFEGVSQCVSKVDDANSNWEIDAGKKPASYVSFAYPVSTYCGTQTERGIGVVNIITWH